MPEADPGDPHQQVSITNLARFEHAVTCLASNTCLDSFSELRRTALRVSLWPRPHQKTLLIILPFDRYRLGTQPRPETDILSVGQSFSITTAHSTNSVFVFDEAERLVDDWSLSPVGLGGSISYAEPSSRQSFRSVLGLDHRSSPLAEPN